MKKREITTGFKKKNILVRDETIILPLLKFCIIIIFQPFSIDF